MKRRLTIWAAFVIFTFCILLTTGALSVFFYITAERIGLTEIIEGTQFNPLVFILFISVILGTIMSAISSKKMMRFVYELRDATKKVAAGDFSVQIKENRKIFELDTLVTDFNKMVKDLGSIETLKDEFITNVSHEIKTPIAAIEGCVELLKEQTLTEDEMKEYINLIDMSVKRLSVMTANILRISKLYNQEILPDKTEFSLDEQIRQAILLLERQWSEKNINLNINLTPVRIFTNKELLMQMWTNLIDNAIKFSEAGGDINIELFQTDGRAYVKVSDFGVGMKEETQKYIFQKFYQGNETRSNQGNGLGLALVKRIVELSGGNISVESQLGKGSVFTVDLPEEKKKRTQHGKI
jgi:signal transduction histidine kinase